MDRMHHANLNIEDVGNCPFAGDGADWNDMEDRHDMERQAFMRDAFSSAQS